MHLPLPDPAPPGVEYLETLWEGYLFIEDSLAAFRAVMALLHDVMLKGAVTPTVDADSQLRVLRTASDSGLPPTRLWFFIEHGTLKLVHIEHYDENEP